MRFGSPISFCPHETHGSHVETSNLCLVRAKQQHGADVPDVCRGPVGWDVHGCSTWRALLCALLHTLWSLPGRLCASCVTHWSPFLTGWLWYSLIAMIRQPHNAEERKNPRALLGSAICAV